MSGYITVDLAPARCRRSGATPDEQRTAARYRLSPAEMQKGTVDILVAVHPAIFTDQSGYRTSRETFADEHRGDVQTFDIQGDFGQVIAYLATHPMLRAYPHLGLDQQAVEILGVQRAYLETAFDQDANLGVYATRLARSLNGLTLE